MVELNIVKEDGDILCALEINDIVNKINELVRCCNLHGGGGQGDNPDPGGGDNPGGGDTPGGGDNPGGEESLDTNESIIVFDFLKPWNLNPSIDVPHEPADETVEVMVTDRTFTNGPVLIEGVLYPDNGGSGTGCSICNISKSDTYSYLVRTLSGMNVKCSSGYYLKSIEFLGASGEFHPYDSQGSYSTVNNIWKTNSQDITEVKFKTFLEPAYWWQIRVHVVNTESGQTTIDLSPERAYLDPLGQTSEAAFFKLTYNDYLKQRCTSSLEDITLKKETSSSENGPWTRSNISANDQYNYKFIDDFGGEFIEYETIADQVHYVRYIVCRDSAWYDAYDIDLAITDAMYIPKRGEMYYEEYIEPLLWFHNKNYITNNNDGSIIIEAEFAASNSPDVIGAYSKYEIEEGSEYITYEFINASGYTDPEILGDKESLAIKIIPNDTKLHTITIKTICSVDPSVYSTVDVTINASE